MTASERPHDTARRRRHAAVLFVLLFGVYNANGREIGGIDSQPAKFAARNLALARTMTVDRDVARAPLLAERPSFARDRQGHYRSAYSVDGILAGGAVAWILAHVARVDLDAPLAPNLIAVLTASLLVAAAGVFVFLTAASIGGIGAGWWTALTLGLGSNLWLMSRTIGEHEVVAFGCALAVFAWTRPTGDLTRGWRYWVAAGLALMVTARLQTAPAAAIVGVGLWHRVGWRRAAAPLLLVAAAVVTLFAAQTVWFGNILGAGPALESLHPQLHGVPGPLSMTPWIGAVGLLVSPNRGLLVFSPIVIVVLAAIPATVARLRDRGAAWPFAAAAVQFLAYSAYSVWWGGHGYGPRYMIDAIIWLTPAAAVAAAGVLHAGWARRTACAVLLAWSIAVAGTGAFFNDPWSTAPADVDTNHARLWDWRDLQIVRSWQAGVSDRDFGVFDRAAVRE